MTVVSMARSGKKQNFLTRSANSRRGNNCCMAIRKQFAAKNEFPEILTGRILTEYDPRSNTKPQLNKYIIHSQK